MQCRECGASIASDVSFCPTCGARQAQPVPPPVQPKPDPLPAMPVKEIQAMSPVIPGKAAAIAVAKSTKSILPQAGETFAGRYRVEKYLGLGALCNSYLCRDLSAGNQEMVLKVMHARKAAEAGMADSFLFLAESVAKYDHKGIAKIYSSGRHEGIPFYTTEWVGGVPLRLWLMERLNFENRVLPGLGIIISLLEIFEAIHERGCYGCLKPENVFITLNGPVITDFGVVGFLSPQEFEFNSYARRYLPYMAPELKQDWSNLLPHSDFHSLGAILYEILVGRAPAQPLRLPSELSRVFGIEADEIILKAMATRPLDRFNTVEAFKHAVLSLQSSLLHARPGSPDAPDAKVIADVPEHPALEIANDLQTFHNPEAIFTSPDLGFGGPEADPPFHGDGPIPVNPWSLERMVAREESEPPGFGEDQRRNSGDRIVEVAHVQPHFTNPGPVFPGLPDGAASQNSAPATAWDAPSTQTALAVDALPDEGEQSAPVPAWLWVCIALTGSCLVVLSAYFGFLQQK
jgi:serine/threonine protein kinase